jgi:hypothetical protein
LVLSKLNHQTQSLLETKMPSLLIGDKKVFLMKLKIKEDVDLVGLSPLLDH